MASTAVLADTRRCYVCGVTKDIAAFCVDVTKPLGRSRRCKECDRAKAIAYYAANRERVIARVREANGWTEPRKCKCGALTTSSRHHYCDPCRDRAAKKRAAGSLFRLPRKPRTHTQSTAERGYGTAHQQLRRAWKIQVDAGGVNCARCGLPIKPGTPWDLGHDDHDRSRYTGPEHRACNRATNGRRPKTSREW